MAATHTVTVTGPHAPSEPGALAGYHLTCSTCGHFGGSSLPSLARQDAAGHERFWAARVR